MNIRRLNQMFIILLLSCCASSIPAKANEIDSQMQTARQLLGEVEVSNDKDKLEQAASIVEKLLQKTELDQSSLAVPVQNIAQFYQIIEQQKQSLEWWHKLLKIEPDNWRAWAKVVQCSQALNSLNERDLARQKVLSLYNQGKVDQKFFCREQFSNGAVNIMALEYFKPEPKMAVEIAFRVSPKNSPETLSRRYTLGESDTDTRLARELKEIGPTEHMYSVDGFNERGQWLLQMTTHKPSYEQLRAMVLADLSKDRKN